MAGKHHPVPNVREELLADAVREFARDGDRVDDFGRAYSGGVPSLFLADSKVHVYIPPFLPVYGEDTAVSIAPQSGAAVEIGSLAVTDDGETAPALIPVEDYGISPLEGFRITMGGSVLFRAVRQYFIFFDATGRRNNDPRACAHVLFDSRNVLDGRGFGYEESYRPDGSCLASLTPDDGWRRFRVRPLREGESRRFRVICEPDRTVADSIARIQRGHPIEDFEPQAVPGSGFRGSPRLLILDGRPVLAVPSYEGDAEDPFAAVLEWPDGEADLGRLPRRSEFRSDPTFVDLVRVGADPTGGLVLRVDGGPAYVYPPTVLSLFTEEGVPTDMPEGRVTALVASGTVLCGDGFEVLEERDMGGWSVETLLVDPDGMVLADDEGWEDDEAPDEEGPRAEAVVEELPPEEPLIADEPEPQVPGPYEEAPEADSVADAVPDDGRDAVLFTNGLPKLVFDGRGFVMRIPSFAFTSVSAPELSVLVDGAVRASLVPKGRARDGTVVTDPVELSLKGMLRASPFDGISVMLGDLVLFSKEAGDPVVMNSRYEYTGVPSGTFVVAMRRRTRYECPYATERSRRTIDGIVFATLVGVRPVEEDAGGPFDEGPAEDAYRIDESAVEASLSFLDDPLELSVRPMPAYGTAAEEDEPQPVPFFDHSPRLHVRTTGCQPEACSVTVRDPNGRRLYGPVPAGPGAVFLDTGGYSGFACASVAVGGTALASVDYLVDPGFWFELPEGEFIHSGNSTARIGWNRRGHRFVVRDGIPLGYGSRPAVLRLNVVLYYVGITVGGMTTRSLLSHRLAGSTELGGRITVEAVISGEGTPVFLKRITVRAGDGPEEPLTRTWTEGVIEVDASGFLQEMAGDHLDRHLSVEEEGRGGFEFLTVKWVPALMQDGETDQSDAGRCRIPDLSDDPSGHRRRTVRGQVGCHRYTKCEHSRVGRTDRHRTFRKSGSEMTRSDMPFISR